MNAVVSNSGRVWLRRHSIWWTVIAVTALHMMSATVVKYGFPDLTRHKVSEITIELDGALPRGHTGEGRADLVQTPKTDNPRPATVKAQAPDENATQRRATDKTQTSGSSVPPSDQVSPGAASAGVDSAPTTDADYKAAYLNNPKPPYPPMAFQLRIEGTVFLKALVLPDGSCGEVLLGRSSGNDLLDRSAMNTVAQWKFVPAKSQGKDVSQWVSIPITFSVKRR